MISATVAYIPSSLCFCKSSKTEYPPQLASLRSIISQLTSSSASSRFLYSFRTASKASKQFCSNFVSVFSFNVSTRSSMKSLSTNSLT